jgi:hypothetical protein
VLAVLVACGLAAGLWWVAPGPSARAASAISAGEDARGAAAQSVLVVRRAGDHDALWLLSPVDGTPTAAGDLPGIAGDVAVSPDGLSAAYLPENGAPRLWIGTGPLAPRTISLTGAGVRRVHTLTWIDDGRLMVSGATRASTGSAGDRLYLVNAATGKVRAFRDLRGTEPSAAPAAGKVAYVRLTTVVPGTSRNNHTPTVRESLKILSLAGKGSGRTVWTEQYQVPAEYRAFSRPQVSPDGLWYLTGSTGSDVRVTYAIRDRNGNPSLTLFTPAIQAGAGWDASGRRTAFAGVIDAISDSTACVWVYDTVAGSLTRSPHGLLGDRMIEHLAWSPAGSLAAGAWVWNGSTSTRHVLVLPGDLTTATDLGTGRLPVWVQP